MSNKIAVLMRTRNNIAILEQTLTALFSQQCITFELHVIDSQSSDQTAFMAQKFPCQFSQIAASAYFPGKVLNDAITRIEADIIIFLNSDAVLLTGDALESLLKPFSEPDVQAAFGRQVARPDALTWVRHEMEKSFPLSHCPAAWVPFALPLAAMRRETWQKRHFYTDAWASEDTEWGIWAAQNGMAIRYVPEAMAMHSHNYTLRQLYGRRFVEGEADVFIFRDRRKSCLWRLVWQMGKSLVGDLKVQWQKKDMMHFWAMPVVRLAYFWAYYRGAQLGWRRLNSSHGDASEGQRAVLSHYDN